MRKASMSKSLRDKIYAVYLSHFFTFFVESLSFESRQSNLKNKKTKSWKFSF